MLLDDAGKPSNALKKLLILTNVSHDGSLASIVDATQKAWLRKPGQERWDMEQRFEEQRKEFMPLFDELDCIAEVVPKKKHYRYALVLGALVSRVRIRLAYLLKLWQEGIVIDEIVLLTGQRPLHPEFEAKDVLLERNNKELPIAEDWQFDGRTLRTESDMIHLLYEQADFPAEFRKIPVTFIDTPMQKLFDGKLTRPTTEDTIKTWLRTKPVPGPCLSVSNQVFVGYQDSVLRTYLPPNFPFETVGSGVPGHQNIAVYLDTVARWLYQEKVQRSKK